MKMVRRTIGAAMAAGLLLVPLGATPAAAEPNDDVKCVVQAIKDGTGVFWCWATVPPPP
ncbi:MAG: hypothetical protein ACRDLB_15890 [Actinomycetota bacterium]